MIDHQAFAQKMHPYTVLYVEDDLEVRHYISEFLEHYCKKVYQSSSAEEGLALYHQHQPDILLLDINLGGMSGVELAQLIRKKDNQTRILIATAYTSKEFLLQAIELGLTRYLVKPLTNEDLVKAFEKCWDELTEENIIYLSKDCLYHKEKALLLHGTQETKLRHKEVIILEYFLAHEAKVIRYEEIEHNIWENESMSRDAIRSQIRNIRQKIKTNLFENISGLGYRFQRSEKA
ncbi:MAG: Regulator [uncultured Sulfurovum sp.]|uniref:Regulator n=1 Tax=uncultured Sulfurovum sp. TaxID=269237 RepID=A0A6S6SK88_9BACT|nr:MAG: Regulator [uncultured Sulfurovum sp.]